VVSIRTRLEAFIVMARMVALFAVQLVACRALASVCAWDVGKPARSARKKRGCGTPEGTRLSSLLVAAPSQRGEPSPRFYALR
jgi:hypothetical protein